LQAAKADEIDTLLTMLKLRDDWQGREMAWWLQWILLRPKRGSEGGRCLSFDRAAPPKQ
jgi:hypothetical protein